ncbi:BRO family protein [Paenibacillus sp. FSL E2-0230]|uniref:BRO family protein n=1 Tax=Paenibacillus sp. FSL E2-0230 TaxID=2954727 RepID=UPI0030D504E9
MDQLTKVFTYESAEVRTVMVEGEPWFVAKDVCAVLEVGNPSQALTRLDEDERNTIILNEGIRGNPNATIVNESGLYSLILGSRKPEARAFKRWITHEVIPSIRKTGMYATDALLDDPDLLLKTVTRLAEERRARLAAEAQIVTMAPKVEAFDTFIDADGTMTVDQVAKLLGMKPKVLRDTLKARKLIRQDGLPYQRYTPRYFEVIPYVSPGGVARPYSRVTTEGIAYIERMLAGSLVPDNVITFEPRRPSSITLNLNLNA